MAGELRWFGDVLADPAGPRVRVGPVGDDYSPEDARQVAADLVAAADYCSQGTPDSATPYDRAVLVDVLVYHQRKDIGHCLCGWGELGRSHAEHVADVYERSVAARLGTTTGRGKGWAR